MPSAFISVFIYYVVINLACQIANKKAPKKGALSTYISLLVKAKSNFETLLASEEIPEKIDLYLSSVRACERLINKVEKMQFETLTMEQYQQFDKFNELNSLRQNRLKIHSFNKLKTCN